MNLIVVAGVFFLLIVILITLILLAHRSPLDPSPPLLPTRSPDISDENYRIVEIPNFLTPEEADRLRQLAISKGLETSKVYSQNREELDLDFRKSRQTWLRDHEDPIVSRLSQKVSEITGLPPSHQESLQIAAYSPGGRFNAHYDACDERTNQCQGMNGVAGPRLVTFLIYLNDDYQGGTTTFPNLRQTVKPAKGKAVVFYDVNPKTGKILEKSLHSGDPLISGEKWIANKWVHLKPYH